MVFFSMDPKWVPLKYEVLNGKASSHNQNGKKAQGPTFHGHRPNDSTAQHHMPTPTPIAPTVDSTHMQRTSLRGLSCVVHFCFARRNRSRMRLWSSSRTDAPRRNVPTVTLVLGSDVII